MVDYKKLVQYIALLFVVLYVAAIFRAVSISIHHRDDKPLLSEPNMPVDSEGTNSNGIRQVPAVPQWVSWVGINMFTILSAFTASVLGLSRLIQMDDRPETFKNRFAEVGKVTGLTWVQDIGVISHLLVLAACLSTYWKVGEMNSTALVTSIGKSALAVALAIVGAYFVSDTVRIKLFPGK